MFQKINSWLTQNAFNLLRISIGVIYVWFGALKFFDNLSPADQLAKDTIALITFELIPNHISIILLAIWETALGFALIIGSWKRSVFFILLIHMFCTLFLCSSLEKSHLLQHLTLSHWWGSIS
jgi:uncharacterized membrane protein YphA (DoxX/SURF4 family)